MNPLFRLSALCGSLLLAAIFSPYSLTAAPASCLPEKLLADTLAPVLTCPATLTITLSAGRCDTFFQYTVTLTDNEPGATMLQLTGTPPSGATMTIGKTVNLFQATDVAGNTSTCVFSVRVKHPAVPLACRDTLKVALDANCSFSVQYLDFLMGSGYGCTQNFTLEMDTLLPLGDGPWLPPLSTLQGRRSLLGYRVTDAGTASKCSGYLRLRDTIPPSLICQDVVSSSLHGASAWNLAGHKLSGAYPTASDNCIDILYYNLISADSNLLEGGCAQVHYKVLRTWTARDEQDNTASCSQVITLLNPDLDEVQFPTDYAVGCLSTISNSISYPFVALNGENYTLHGSGFKFEVAYKDTLLGLPCEGAAVWQRTWTVKDNCTEKTRRDTHLFEIQDKSRVVVYCKILELLPAKSVDNCTAAIDLPDLYLDDICSRVASVTAFWADVQGTQDSLAGSLTTFPEQTAARRDTLGHFATIPDFPLGQTLVTFVATDPCGNTGTCVSRVSVLDKKPPTAVCDTLITVFLGKNGKAQLYADKFNTASYDNCTASPSSLEFRVHRADGAQNTCSPSPLYDSWARFCCVDLGDTVPVALRVYDIDFGTDTISANRFVGQYSDCTARVLVRDSLPPLCSPMPLINLTCTTWRDEFAQFDPHQFTSCSTDSVLVKIDSSQLTPCGEGKITRSISVFDAQGQHTGTCKQTVSVYSNSLFYVKFPSDTDTYGKCPNALGNTGEPKFYTPTCNQYEMWHTDSLIALLTNPCFSYIRRRWYIKNTCATPGYGNVMRVVPNPEEDLGPTVSSAHVTGVWAPTKAPTVPNGQINNYWWYQNSYGYEYDQHIRLRTLPVSSDAEASGTTSLGSVPYIADSTINDGLLWNHSLFSNPGTQGNNLNEAPSDLTFTIKDSCGMGRLHFSYQLNLDLDGDGTRETKVTSLSCGLGNRGMVQFNNNKPGSTSSWAQFDSRPLQDYQKYCFTVRTDTVGSLFTAHAAWSDGLTSSIVPVQLPYGQHEIIWFVESGCNYWEKNKSILFTVGPANPAQHKVSGHVRTEPGVGIEDVKMSLLAPTLSVPGQKITDDAGAYQFDSPLFESLNYAIAPEKDQNPLNGVSTYDLTIISKHILGLESIASPYRIIAADANRSGSVTTFDIVEIRKLILGIYPKLPNAPSWRFVPKSFVFLQPDNPFVKGFPEKIERINLPADRADEDFVGIKVGDLNGNAIAHAQGQAEDRNGSDPVALETDDRFVQAGETFTTDFWVKKPVAGYQFTLETPGLSVTDVESGPAMSPDHFSLLPDALAVSFEAARGREAHFQVTFKAEKSGALSQMLHLSDRIARSEAYPLGQPIPPAEMKIRFNSVTGAVAEQRRFEVFPNQPNPFGEETLLPFYLPADAQARLTVYDPAGRILLQHSVTFPKGFRSFSLKKRDLGAVFGVLYYRIETESGAATRKMVVD